MSEYIYGFVKCERIPEYRLERREKIVRCRDCKHADWDITAWWCTRDKHNPFKIGELRGYDERSQLGGFCAWGERRGDA